MEHVCSYLSKQTEDLEAASYPALEALTTKVNSQNLDRVRRLKGRMNRLIGRTQQVKEELENILDDDKEIRQMYLTRRLVAEEV